jgi:hypothetical protein
VVVFYQSGGFVVLSVKGDTTPNPAPAGRGQARVTWTRLVVYAPTDVSHRARRSVYTRQRGDPTIICEFHWPVLVSCTERFYISVWRIPDLTEVTGSDGSPLRPSPTLLQTLHSSVSFHPATLSLTRLPRTDSAEEDGEEDASADLRTTSVVADSYRATLAYSVPLYPERWTLAVQDIDISIPGSGNRSTTGDVECGECFHVGRSATAGSKTLRNRWPLLARSEIVGVKGDRAIGIALGSSCCVLAGSDNQIQVYELPDRSPGAGLPKQHVQPPHTASAVRREIRHVQTLLAHSSAITAIALDQGRCVSAGNDGRILVWQVDRAADVFPTEEGGDFEVEETEAVDQAGGWVNVCAGSSRGKSTESSPIPNWSHVEVRTPRKTNPIDSQSRSKGELILPPISPMARPVPSSSTTSLHQRFLPIPPVTHPLSLASAAKEYLISPRTSKMIASDSAQEEERASRIVEQLAFNEDRIVGLVKSRKRAGGRVEDVSSVDSVIKVWTFDM